ncbi:MAG: DUF357 domain-containing protein [Methanothrix sp.]|nr:DUF357 domain-containing protein [Methanothrix sp.]
MGTREELSAETEKWLERARAEVETVSARGDGGERFLSNIKAYISDCRYFAEKGDLIRAFEAVIWAWAWIEIGLEVGVLVKKGDVGGVDTSF